MAIIIDWRSIDNIEGTGGNDFLMGLWGDDEIYGGDGNDVIIGGSGDDFISGGAGNDYLSGGRGDDIIDGGSGNDKIRGGTGNDVIYTGSGKDVVFGGAGDDTIHGGEGKNVMFGGCGNDTIYFGVGNNVIRGGSGHDEAHIKLYQHINNGTSNLYRGGSGSDTLVIWLDSGDPTPYVDALVDAGILNPTDRTTVINTRSISHLTKAWADSGLDSGFKLKIKGVEAVRFELENEAPTGVGDNYDVSEDSNLFVTAPGVLLNDVDPDTGDTLTVAAVNGSEDDVGQIVTLASGASLLLRVDGSFDYWTNGSFEELAVGSSATDSFSYTVQDLQGEASEATVQVTIAGANDSAVITGDSSGDATEDTVLNISGTLTATDVDSGEFGFQSGSQVGTYGSLDIDASGNWSYVLDNSAAAVQSLDAGESDSDSFIVNSIDGTAHTITMTVNGTEDAPVITGIVTGTTEEDGTQIATGNISITDVDTSDNPVSFPDATVTSEYGEFALAGGAWTYTLDNSRVQFLDAGETATDSHTFTATDGSTQQITITVVGAEDASIIGGTYVGEVTEDGTLTAGGTLSITDVDDADNPVSFEDVVAVAGDNGLGTFSLTGEAWSYTLDNNNSYVQSLDAGESVPDHHTFTATDGSTQEVYVIITGAEDAAVISGAATGAVTEDGTQTATGTLTITDVDTSDNPVFFPEVSSTAGDNGYGNFEMTGGTWTYTLNNDHAAVQALDEGETLTDTHTFTATDGSDRVVEITITGAEDLPLIEGTISGNVAEDGIQIADGTLSISDVDTSDNPVFFPDVGATLGAHGYGHFAMTAGAWTYTLDNSAAQHIDAGETKTDSYEFTATDGSKQLVTITILGAEDAPNIVGTFTAGITEDGAQTVSRPIAITDVDTSDNPVSFPNVAPTLGANGYGDFSLTGGSWSYALNNSLDEIQSLDEGETLTDSYVFTATDGSTQQVTVTIHGSEDQSVISGVLSGQVVEDHVLTVSGTPTITDVDTSDNPIWFPDQAPVAGYNGYGQFKMLGGVWTYTLDNGLEAVQAIDTGEIESDFYGFTASDGTGLNVWIDIYGVEDGAEIGGTFTGTVTEDGTQIANGTLTITDVDTSDNPVSFPDATATGTYGDFVLAGGAWTYTLDNAKAQVLDAGETRTDTHTFTATDGSTQQVVITVAGAEDAPHISGSFYGEVVEDGWFYQTAIGSLSITDVDDLDNPISFPDVTSTLGDYGYGHFSMTEGTWTYTLNNESHAVQSLDEGEISFDSHTFTATDGSTKEVRIDIYGAEDYPIIIGDDIGYVTEDINLMARGRLTIYDVDTLDNPVEQYDEPSILGENGYGIFELSNEVWTYTLNNDHPDIQGLDAGERLYDSHVFLIPQYMPTSVWITILGTEDNPVIGGTHVGEVAEDGIQTATGTLTITDTDTSDNPISFPDAPAILEHYGTFEISAGGWLYTLDNNRAQSLAEGEVQTDSHTFVASDGFTTQQVDVTITGTNDAPVLMHISPLTVDEGASGVIDPGMLVVTDVDNGPNEIFYTIIALPGHGSLLLDGHPMMEGQNFTHADLMMGRLSYVHDGGESTGDGFAFTVSDIEGATLPPHGFQININPVNDAPTDISLSSNTVAENLPAGTVIGTLVAADVDNVSHTFSLVAASSSSGEEEVEGEGESEPADNDNASFQIVGNQLLTAEGFNHEAKSSYNILVEADDGNGGTYQQEFTITVGDVNDAPVVDPITGLTYQEATGPVVIDDTITVSDVDSPNLVSATIRIANYQAGEDVLAAPGLAGAVSEPIPTLPGGGDIAISDTAPGDGGIVPSDDGSSDIIEDSGEEEEASSINASWDAGNGTLTLTGDASVAEYQAALRSITYENLSNYPDTTPRQIEWVVNDGELDSALVTSIVDVIDLNEMPTDIILSNAVVDETMPVGTVVGNLSAVDSDLNDTHFFSLVAGAGDADNASFTILGGQLRTAAEFDYEAQSSYSIRVQADDGHGGTYEEAFTVNVTDVNEAPTDISLSSNTITENQPTGTVVGDLSAFDPDLGDTHTFSLVTGTGDADNASFTIDGGQLKTAAEFDYGTKDSYSIRIQADDGNGETYEEVFTINVADVLYVNDSAAGSNDGSTWEHAFTDLQSAFTTANNILNAGGATPEIWIAGGVYKPTTGTDVNARFTLMNGVKIYGGFAGIEGAIAERDLSNNDHETILSGNINDPETNTDNAHNVLYAYDVSDILLDSITVSDGYYYLPGPVSVGAGLRAMLSDIDLNNVTFKNNTTMGNGGAIYTYQGSLDITNSRFFDNTGKIGGAINTNGTLNIENCVFANNQGEYSVAAVFSGGLEATITNSTFANNNPVENTPYTIFGVQTITNSIVWNDTNIPLEHVRSALSWPTVNYSNVQQAAGIYPGDGNINVDPNFVNAADYLNNGLVLQADSPCIDAGLDLAATLPHDIDGETPRVVDTPPAETDGNAIDMGAHEYLNLPPTDIALDSYSVPENEPVGTVVGNLTVTDPNVSDTHTFSLVTGTGDADNASFTIDGNELKTTAEFNYEVKDSYSIRVEADDGEGGTYQKAFTITVGDVNETPIIADATLSIDENSGAGVLVGQVAAFDPDDNVTGYEIIAGNADGFFEIDETGNIVVADGSQLDHETTDSYVLTVKATDAGGLTDTAEVTINVNDVNEAPTDISLSSNTVTENLPAGTVVGDLTATDPESGDTHTFSLVTGTGDADNASFTIVGNQLQTSASFDYQTKSSCSVRVQADDGNGGTYEEVFTINVADVLYVNDSAAGSSDGSTWEHAFTDLQSAFTTANNILNAGGATPEIWIAGGVYKPTTGTDENARFTLMDGVKIYGGFAGIEGAIAERDLSSSDYETILSGNINNSETNTDNAHNVLYAYNVSDILLDSVTVSDGYYYLPGPTSVGAGLRAMFSDIELNNVTFKNNTTMGNGGAIYTYQGSLDITNSRFFDNTGKIGGAINTNGTLNIENCVFANNQGEYSVAAVFSGGLEATITNSTFANNNPVENTPYTIFGVQTITNSIVWNDTNIPLEHVRSALSWPTVNYSNVQQAAGIYPGDGNINVDPNFVNAADYLNNGLVLQADSPCIDAGLDSAATLPHDIDGETPRVVDTPPAETDGNAIDMGAHEYEFTPYEISVTDDTVLDLAGNNLTVAVSLERAVEAGETVTVDYNSADGSATAGSDYSAVSGSLVFNPGEQTKTIQVPVLGNTASFHETLYVNLTSPSTNATIVDDSGAGLLIAPTLPPIPGPYSADFNEEPDDGFDAEGQWEYGVAFDVSDATHNYVWGTNLSGDYDHDSSDYLTSPTIDATGHTGLMLNFSLWLELEAGDYDHFRVLVEDSGVRWQLMEYDGDYFDDPEWNEISLPLAALSDTSNFKILFQIETDGSTNELGAYIGSLSITSDQTVSLTYPTLVEDSYGTSSTVTGTSGADVIVGYDEADVLEGGGGDDTLVYDAADTTVDGGAGDDTLLVHDESSVDLANPALANLEKIELAGQTGQELVGSGTGSVVTEADVLNVTSDPGVILTIDAATSGHSMSLASSDWSQGAATGDYTTFTSVGGATLIVDTTDITVDLV